MNEQGKQALIKVAEWLEAGAPHVIVKDGVEIGKFDMEFGGSPIEGGCGTACCIAGTLVQFEGLMSPNEEGEIVFFSEVDEDDVVEFKGAGQTAQEFCDITKEDSYNLFQPWTSFDYNHSSEFSSAKRAAAVVRHFIDTGDVDWDRFDLDGNAA